MAETKDFDVIRIARSDGADTGPGYWPVVPATAAAAVKKTAKDAAVPEKTPRAKPQMTRLAEDDPRFVEWRVKLGILLKQELSPNPDEGHSWYVQFPRGYWLYEKSKHLWVSGYPIKSKLFKSPQEFGLHLIWLLSASKDYGDCCCVHCNLPNVTKLAIASDDGISSTPTEAPAKLDKVQPKVTPVPLPPIPGQPPAQATPQAISKSPAPPQLQPQPQPQQQPPQHVPWTLQAPLLFRIGELVWYQTGSSWRLGLIAAPGNGGSELLPIGHATVQQRNVGKTDADMRPYHAFSVPPVVVPDLTEKSFDEVPWEAIFQAPSTDPGRRDLLALDASKMAAAKIDYSFSLWSPLSEDPNGKATYYYGCFLGAERVEVGDCLRLRSLPPDLGIKNEAAVLAVRSILISKDAPGAVFFRGAIYQPVPAEAATAPDDALPVALRDENQWRAQTGAAQHWRWGPAKENVLLKEQSVKGRFYPAQRLMAVLNPGARGDEAYAQQLNNRMETGARYIGRRRNRVDTLGASVPKGARLVLEAHIREEA